MSDRLENSLQGPEGPGSADRRAGPAPPGIWQRIVALFSAPRKAFALPWTSSMWTVPLVIVSLAGVTQGVLLRPLSNERARATIENSQRIPEEQKEQMLERIEAGQNSPAGQIGPPIAILVGTWLLAYLLPAVLYLFGLNFVLGARARFWEVFTVTAFSGLILVVREVVRVPVMLAKHSLDVYTSPAALVNPDNTALVYGLNIFDVFDIYRLIVLAIGLAVLTGLPLKRAGFPVLVVWLLYAVAGLGCVLSPLGQFMR
jgi:hypothetical protein